MHKNSINISSLSSLRITHLTVNILFCHKMYNLESSRESCYDLMSIIIVLPEVLTLYHVIAVCGALLTTFYQLVKLLSGNV